MIAESLRLSLLVATTATLLVAVIGTICGRLFARRRFPGRSLLDALLNLPLILPPTVTGYYLIVFLGRRGVLGGPVFEATGWSLTFTWLACVIAASVMSFPLMFRAARVAFEEVDPRHETAAASLGHADPSIFLRVSIPLARRGLMAGVMLTFARSLGEFGATLMLAGNIPGRTQTLPLALYEAVVAGDMADARLLVILLTIVSISVMLVAGRLGRRRR